MATAKKKQSSKKPASNDKKKSAGNKNNKNSKNTDKSGQQHIDEGRSVRLWAQIAPYLLFVGAVLLIICFINGSGKDPGIVTGFICKFLTGCFGGAAFALPAFFAIIGVAGLMDKNIFGLRFACGAAAALFVSVLLEIISPLGSFKVAELYSRGAALSGGGVVGGLIGEASLACFKTAGSYVIVIALLVLSIILCAGLTPQYLFVYFSYKLKESKQKRAAEGAERRRTADSFKNADRLHEAYEEYDDYSVDTETGEVIDNYDVEDDRQAAAIPETPRRRRKFETDVPIDDFEDTAVQTHGEDNEFEADESEEVKRERLMRAQYEEVMRRSSESKSKEELAAEKKLFDDGESAGPEVVSGNADDSGLDIIDKIADAYLGRGSGEDAADSGETLEVRRTAVSKPPVIKQLEIEFPKPDYKFPPIELLSEDVSKKADVNVREEMHDNAQKLVNVLASFNVKTKIVGVSRGPTITRYELLPEAGVRVRSISNLIDDIALNLATGGVRIEAPIPGKAAVGIEVPNKSAETVYLRSLISNAAFTENKSKIATCLGKNVAGDPIIMDIKKMPHLLIAGATGMGKSVCINCLLVSLLYKAKPEEVKLILIDPKKVEFSIYNGLPHLLVPVVSDPKKAAGSLTWAVNEMERRFGLIEAVGVRDLEGFNEITKNDPEYEYMPQIVIVIDELADLMATAPDDVETSIARLAAKARAAGMHLVIGTQRPSVDVITGVIKANIPSRIAFTVASQVDSRTIIDKSGAENLIGRGDMLYNPVGSSKPMRVQGAFVSEKEVEAIVSYIKTNNAPDGTAYSDDIIKEIEVQAAMCGSKKGSGGAAAAGSSAEGEDDPLMDRAMEVAFESGRISTSLLQRRLSIGYGRGAKIIDRMEQLGYVSAPDGQKPRELLITKQDYMEMSVRNSSDTE